MWCCSSHSSLSPTSIDERTIVITILHFNDVYNVESRENEPMGGAARFCTAMKSFKHLDPLIFFSGDLLSPSVLSTFTHGEHMLDVFNAIGVDCSVYGNHDFDFGVDHLVQFVTRMRCPWLLSNVIDKETNEPLGDGHVSYTIEHKGIKFGFLGLVEEEWLSTLATIDIDDVIYTDYVTEGRKLATRLKRNDHVDYVIALTHMRFPNDCRLAENVEEIDLILGGHDHVFETKKVNNKYIIKSGTDFQNFSKITLTFSHSKVNTVIEEIFVTSKYEEDPQLKESLKEYGGVIELKMDEVLGYFSFDLDGRFSSVRTMETNLGNFVCDVMLAATHSDITILNSGTIRSDRIYPKGPFKMRDLISALPMMDPMIILNCSGETVWKALENGVSQYPKLDGRFPQVAGISFVFDPTKPSNERIDPRHIKVGYECLEMNQMYRLVTKKYCALGKDGYEALRDCEVLVDEENTPELCVSVQNHFKSIQILTGALTHRSHHRQSLFCMSRRASLKPFEEKFTVPVIRRSTSYDTSLSQKRSLARRVSVEEIEHEQCKLAPRVEGRIRIFTQEIEIVSVGTVVCHVVQDGCSNDVSEELQKERNQHTLLVDVIEENESSSETS